jgi:dTDP-glucose 4,6-dehydratase
VRLLITGGAGFIGSNFVRRILEQHPDYSIVNVDKLTYAGNLENLAGLETEERHQFVHADICDADAMGAIFERGLDGVVHFAAESHVDRSILEPHSFVQTNIHGSLTLLDLARKHRVERFVQVSTDEVYGSLGPAGSFTEETPLAPNSPYAASKAGADLLARSYFHTYGVPVAITRCSNNYGPYQFPEKLIPLLISNALADVALPIYGDGLNIRDWIHVADHCAAVDRVLHHGVPGKVYNIGARHEMTNLQIVRAILGHLRKDESLITFVKDRPGHDRRYSIDPARIESELGWKPQIAFEEGICQTIDWYRSNPSWVDHVRSGEYRSYYQRMYGERQRTLSEL